MDTILPVMLVVAMIATAAVLFVGVISFAVGGKATQKYATKLMAARVICQGVAIALFGAMVLLYAL